MDAAFRRKTTQNRFIYKYNSSNVVDTHDELSAFDTIHIKNQAEYLVEGIHFILSNYNRKSIVIIAHSMGGIVARHLVRLDGFNASIVHAIYTLATPHTEPPIAISHSIYSFYKNLNADWKDIQIPLVSIAGGSRDLMVDSKLTHIDGLFNSNSSFSVYTTGIPGTWSSSDHEGMIWCDQLLTTISTAIYSTWTPKIDVDKKMIILKDLFLGSSNIKELRMGPIETIESRDILVHIQSNIMQIPFFETARGEHRYAKI